MRDFTTSSDGTRAGDHHSWASLAALLASAISAACAAGPKPHHAIKATVTGLVSSETRLVLQVNGGHDVEVAAEGEVTLARMVEGTHYNVAVKTQPQSPAQACTVSHETGVVGSADVTDVTVRCAINGYHVRGFAKGLRGSNLKLQLDVNEQKAEDLYLNGGSTGDDIGLEFETRVSSLALSP